jgi:hypothetical protein
MFIMFATAVRSEITARSWEGAPATVFRMRW